MGAHKQYSRLEDFFSPSEAERLERTKKRIEEAKKQAESRRKLDNYINND